MPDSPPETPAQSGEDGPLTGRRIIVPESRELKLFSGMLEAAGATVIRCPMVAIVDVEDFGPVDAWLGRLAAGALDDLIFFTGEGVSRLIARAETLGAGAAVRAAMAASRKIVRGPKPIRALRQIGLSADLVAEPPTTDGVITVLRDLALSGRRVGVQLFPSSGSEPLTDILLSMGAIVDPVLPYRYVDDVDDDAIAALIGEMAAGQIDLIAFTSAPQVHRLVRVAQRLRMEPDLAAAFQVTKVATVGPLTSEAVEKAGGRVSMAPTRSFHLKPLVAAIVAALQAE